MTLNEDGRRVEFSAAISMSVHGLIFGIYLFFRLTKPVGTQLMLTQVEFLDLKPVPAAEAAPGGEPARAPRSVKDFIRMALPKFHKTEVQEGPQEAEMPKDMMKMPSMRAAGKMINLDHDPGLARGAQIKLDDARLPRASASAAMGDVAARATGPRASDLAAVAEPKSISLEAVGRRAVSAVGGSINIDTGKALNRGGGFREISGPSMSAAVKGTSGGAASGVIDLKEDAVVGGRPARMPGGSMPVGYSRGSGISLSEKPVGRAASGMMPEPVAKKKPAESKMAVEKTVKNKGLEISGPLAGRKIVSLTLPKYPDWARAKGIEADVVIRFFVSPDGRVLERMILERTSGYPELDQEAEDALKKIVFVPLAAGQEEDQWGIITFRFRLK